jgi:hypothetical protein
VGLYSHISLKDFAPLSQASIKLGIPKPDFPRLQMAVSMLHGSAGVVTPALPIMWCSSSRRSRCLRCTIAAHQLPQSCHSFSHWIQGSSTEPLSSYKIRWTGLSRVLAFVYKLLTISVRRGILPNGVTLDESVFGKTRAQRHDGSIALCVLRSIPLVWASSS